MSLNHSFTAVMSDIRIDNLFAAVAVYFVAVLLLRNSDMNSSNLGNDNSPPQSETSFFGRIFGFFCYVLVGSGLTIVWNWTRDLIFGRPLYKRSCRIFWPENMTGDFVNLFIDYFTMSLKIII